MVGRLAGAVVVGVVGVGVEVAGVGGRRQAEGSCNEESREGCHSGMPDRKFCSVA